MLTGYFYQFIRPRASYDGLLMFIPMAYMWPMLMGIFWDIVQTYEFDHELQLVIVYHSE